MYLPYLLNHINAFLPVGELPLSYTSYCICITFSLCSSPQTHTCLSQMGKLRSGKANSSHECCTTSQAHQLEMVTLQHLQSFHFFPSPYFWMTWESMLLRFLEDNALSGCDKPWWCHDLKVHGGASFTKRHRFAPHWGELWKKNTPVLEYTWARIVNIKFSLKSEQKSDL